MEKPCFRPGIGVYSLRDEIHIELYPVEKRIEFKADELGKKLISLFDGKSTVVDILAKVRLTDENYSMKELTDFINQLEKLNLLYDATCSNFEGDLGNLSRQIDYFNMYPSRLNYQTEILDIIHDLKVLIIGCGGLGSSIFENLVRCGIRNIIIIDDDYVEHKNLCNQSIYSLNNLNQLKVEALRDFAQSFNPDISVEIIKDKINTVNVDTYTKNVDFVFNCADEPSIKFISKIVSLSCFKYNKPHIVGGGYSGHRGAIGMFIIPFETLCWECYLNTTSGSKIKKQELVSPKNEMSFYPLVSIVASIQVGEFFRHYTERKKYLLTNRFSEFNFDSMSISARDVHKSCECTNCLSL